MASYSMIVTILLLCDFLGHTNSQGNLLATDTNVYEVSNDWDNRQGTEEINLKVTEAQQGFKNILKQKCLKNEGEVAFKTIDLVTRELAECAQNLSTMAQYSQEMASYAITKDLHHVIKYYCRNTHVIKKCASNFMAAIKPCLDPREKDMIKIAENIIDALLSYVCIKDGDHIVQFISADGPKCVESKKNEIIQCAMPTFMKYAQDILPDPFGTKDCMDITTMQSCIVKKLKECSHPTPANIVNSLFNVMLRATPCKKFFTNGSAASTSAINLLATTILFLVLK